MNELPKNTPREEHSPTWRALDGLSKYQPETADAERALNKAMRSLRQHETQNRSFSRRWLMRVSAAAAVVVVVIIGWITFGPEGGLTSPTWADVLNQTLGVRVAKLDVHNYEGKTLVGRVEMYVQAPSTLRMQEYEYTDSKEVVTEGAIVTPEGGIRWNAGSGVAERVGPDNAYVAPASSAKMILGLLGMAIQMDTPETQIDINQTPVKFEPVNYAHPIESALRGYQLRPVSPEEKAGVPMFEMITFWFDPDSNSLQRMTFAESPEDYAGEWHDVLVAFEPVLESNWFEVKAPEGYLDASGDLRDRLPDDVRDVYDKAAAAREAFGDYRALIWSQRQGWGLPIYRESRKGKQWRADQLAWTNLRFQEVAEVRGIGPDGEMADAWLLMTEPEFEPDLSAIRWDGQFVLIYYHLSGRGPRVSASLYPNLATHGHDTYWGPTLRVVAWPRWMSWESEHPHGRDIREPLLEWRLLPKDVEHPDLVEVVAERDKESNSYVHYTFDVAHDYVCVRQEVQEYRGQVKGRVVLELAQTSQGKWYPKRVAEYTRSSGDDPPASNDLEARYTYLVGSGVAADDTFFTWPEGVPQPTDPFDRLRSRRFTAEEKAAEEQGLPPTALGKYTYMPNHGLPRGFDNEAESKAHSQMIQTMRKIEEAARVYAAANHWNAPPDLAALVDGGYITADELHNPLNPDADQPFGYIYIPKNLPNSSGRVVLYEPFTTWLGVVTVMFGDGTTEAVHDEQQFHDLVKAATSPEDPKRYGE